MQQRLMRWELRHGGADFTAVPVVMGVLNVTPDSFFDGGLFADPVAACRRAGEMVAQGAGIIDIGPESTRPGSDPVSPEAQIDRIRSILPAIRRDHPGIPISIDTRRARVAAAAIEMGADIINDVSALTDDPEMAALAAGSNTPVILMHKRGQPKTMQADPQNLLYGDVVGDIADFLTARVDSAEQAGIPRAHLAIDPGIGFGKTTEQNLEIIHRLGELVGLGFPVVLGASRKRFIGQLLDRPDPAGRLAGSLACAVVVTLAGAHVIRAHDVGQTAEAVRLAALLRDHQDLV